MEHFTLEVLPIEVKFAIFTKMTFTEVAQLRAVSVRMRAEVEVYFTSSAKKMALRAAEEPCYIGGRELWWARTMDFTADLRFITMPLYYYIPELLENLAWHMDACHAVFKKALRGEEEDLLAETEVEYSYDKYYYMYSICQSMYHKSYLIILFYIY